MIQNFLEFYKIKIKTNNPLDVDQTIEPQEIHLAKKKLHRHQAIHGTQLQGSRQPMPGNVQYRRDELEKKLKKLYSDKNRKY